MKSLGDGERRWLLQTREGIRDIWDCDKSIEAW